MPKKVSTKQSVKASKIKSVSQQQKSRNVKQNQKVIVNVSTSKGSRRTKSAPAQMPVRYPNSIGYALNTQAYSIPPPPILEYNAALANMKAMREAQQKTGRLIPNQQVNSLYSTISATPRPESLGDNPFLRNYNSRNTQKAMVDPYESLVENIVEDGTTSDAYNPDPNGQESVGVKATLGDLPAGIVYVGANEELLLKEMSKGLNGDASSLMPKTPSVSLTTEQALNKKAFSDAASTLDYFDKPRLEENLGRSSKKSSAIGATYARFPTFIPAAEPKKRGRPPKPKSTF